MPTPTKRTDQMSKHLTKAEREQRQAAESKTLKARGKPKQAPAIIGGKNSPERKYWNAIWKGMEELEILDTVDQYALGSLCSLLVLRDTMATLIPSLLDRLEEMELSSVEEMTGLAEALGQCGALSLKRLKVETQILALEDKLGLTPNGRSRLAVHRQEAEAPDKDDDLFGP